MDIPPPDELSRLTLVAAVMGRLLVIFSAPLLSIVFTHLLTRKH